MPIIKSAKKRVRVAQKATVRNVKTKKNLRTALKSFQAAIEKGDKKKIAAAQSEVYSAIDVAAKKNVMSFNKASRKKGQISAKAKAAGATSAPAAKNVGKTPQPKGKKPTAKKPAAKPVAAAKKPAAKKAAPKKPAAKTSTKK